MLRMLIASAVLCSMFYAGLGEADAGCRRGGGLRAQRGERAGVLKRLQPRCHGGGCFRR